MKKFYLFILILHLCLTSYSQCTNCGSVILGSPFSIAPCSTITVSDFVLGGKFAVFNVTQGVTYTWSSCGSSALAINTQFTLFEGSSCGSGTVLAYNDDACGNKSSITWTATFTGTVTLLVNKFDCQISSGLLELPVSL